MGQNVYCRSSPVSVGGGKNYETDGRESRYLYRGIIMNRYVPDRLI